MQKPETPTLPAATLPELKKEGGVVSGLLLGKKWTTLDPTDIQSWIDFFQANYDDAVTAGAGDADLAQIKNRLDYYKALKAAVLAK